MKLIVIIPAYNEEKSISKVIEAIPKSHFLGKSESKNNGGEGALITEVIVIDDGSRD